MRVRDSGAAIVADGAVCGLECGMPRRLRLLCDAVIVASRKVGVVGSREGVVFGIRRGGAGPRG